jgi:hypothetical protein
MESLLYYSSFYHKHTIAEKTTCQKPGYAHLGVASVALRLAPLTLLHDPSAVTSDKW